MEGYGQYLGVREEAGKHLLIRGQGGRIVCYLQVAGKHVVIADDDAVVVVPDADGPVLWIYTIFHGRSLPEFQIIKIQVSQKSLLGQRPERAMDNDHRGFKTHGMRLMVIIRRTDKRNVASGQAGFWVKGPGIFSWHK